MPRKVIEPKRVHQYVERAIGGDLHAKRVLSMANAVTGTLHAAALSIHAIGQGLAQACDLDAKHAVKQVDRLLSNSGVDPWALFSHWVPYAIGARVDVVVALDWTEFDGDDQATIALNLVTSHGRATQLVWKTVPKADLEGRRNEYEDQVLRRLSEVVPKGVHVTVLADRGFGDQKLYIFLRELGFDFVIRFRGCITVTAENGESMPAQEWLRPDGRAVMLRNARVTNEKTQVGAVVCVHQRGMKDPWFLATSLTAGTASAVIRLYGRRFTIEENFRDSKDPRFGLGLSATHIKSAARRDRLLLIAALAIVLLTFLGAASERIGFDRRLKANTVKRRTHSLFRQGLYWFGAIPNMRAERLRPLMKAFDEVVREHRVFTDTFGLI
jgi:hypothetical protein